MAHRTCLQAVIVASAIKPRLKFHAYDLRVTGRILFSLHCELTSRQDSQIIIG